jgi:hypothetical protein
MKQFRFRLEKVLAWRHTELEVEQFKTRQLAAVLEKIEQQRYQVLVDRTTAERAILDAGRVDGADLAAHAGHLTHLGRLDQGLLVKRAEAERKLAAQQKKLLETQRRCRLLEKLRARRYDEWQAEATREMENFAAETHLARWTPQRT